MTNSPYFCGFLALILIQKTLTNYVDPCLVKTNVRFVFAPSDPIFTLYMQKTVEIWYFGSFSYNKRRISFNKATDGYNHESKPFELPFYVSFTLLYYLLVIIGFFTKNNLLLHSVSAILSCDIL